MFHVIDNEMIFSKYTAKISPKPMGFDFRDSKKWINYLLFCREQIPFDGHGYDRSKSNPCPIGQNGAKNVSDYCHG